MLRYTYDSWGNHDITVLDSSCEQLANLNPFRYRSYYYDTETDLYFLKTRYYDPEIGRFISIDGISYLNPNAINGLNLYAYCNNNPVMYVDYDGTEAILVTNYTFGKYGIPIVGHSALFIEYNDQWYFTEFGGSGKSDAEAIFGPLKEIYANERQGILPDSAINNPEEFIALYYNGGATSSNFLYLDTDYSKIESYDKLKDEIEGIGVQYTGKYNLILNNCAHYVQEVVNLGINSSIMATKSIMIPSLYATAIKIEKSVKNIGEALSDGYSSALSVYQRLKNYIKGGLGWLFG